jgi:hypothetical protein
MYSNYAQRSEAANAVARYLHTSGESYRAFRLANCKRFDRCQDRLCPHCRSFQSNGQTKRLLIEHEALRNRHPRHRFRVVTLPVANTEPDPVVLRQTVRSAYTAVGRLFKSQPIHAAYYKIEVAPAKTNTVVNGDFTVHGHAILWQRQRSEIEQAHLTADWADLLNPLGLEAREAYFELPRTIPGALAYACKSEFWELSQTDLLGPYIEAMDCPINLQRFLLN